MKVTRLLSSFTVRSHRTRIARQIRVYRVYLTLDHFVLIRVSRVKLTRVKTKVCSEIYARHARQIRNLLAAIFFMFIEHLSRESPLCICSREQNSGAGIIVAVFGSTRPFGGELSLSSFTISSLQEQCLDDGTSACPAPSLMTCCPASERGSPSPSPT